MDDVVLNKAASLERCIKRVREEYVACSGKLEQDILRQDSILLNLQRSCEIAIDLAVHIVRVRRLGLPNETREVFSLLQEAGVISLDLQERLQKMVAFRNIAMHEYIKVDLDIVKAVIEKHLDDFLALSSALLRN